MHPISDAFLPILGLPAWQVRKGHGSFITLEFGEPELTIEEPRVLPVLIDDAKARTMIRHVHVSGQWHLWIYCCAWSLTLDGAELAHCEADDTTIGRALRVLNGQALTSVEVEPADGGTTFAFDLGCALATRPLPDETPNGEPVEQWMLYQPSGAVLTVRGDGQYRLQPGNTPGDDGRWAPIPV